MSSIKPYVNSTDDSSIVLMTFLRLLQIPKHSSLENNVLQLFTCSDISTNFSSLS